MFRQMEKLIELLNEYERKVRKKSVFYPVWFYDENIGFHHGNTEYNLNDEYAALITSKKFGFIKWLVENEKIDYEKIEKQTKCKNIVGGKEFLDFDIERDFTPYEEVLMWLAIQDEPIEFLVSILK